MLRRRGTLLLLAATLALALAVPAGAVTYGTPDGDDHPYVVLVTFYYDTAGDGIEDDPVFADGAWQYPPDYQWRCTGTLLDADTVLTAGHCTHGVPWDESGQPMAEPADMQLAHVYINYDSTTVHPAKTFDVGRRTPTGADTFDHLDGTPIPHPQYNDAWSEFPQTWDVGVVELPEPVSRKRMRDEGIDPGLLPQLAALDTIDAMSPQELKDARFETVGYGLQYTRGPWRFQGDWVRYRAESEFVNDTSNNNGDYSVQTTNNKGKSDGGSCFGDSGGPVFLYPVGEHPEAGERHTIIAVVSWGYSPNCTGTDWSYRVDRSWVQDWLVPLAY